MITTESASRTASAQSPESPAEPAAAGRWVAWWYLCLGLALAPASATLVWSHLRVEGLTLVAATALVGLAAGVAALATGARGVWARLPTWRRIVAVPLLLATLYCLVLPWCLAVFATVAPRPPLDAGAAQRAGLAVVDVSFPTADGTTLSGWYVAPRNGAVVILLHGSSSTRAEVIDEAAAFVRSGYGVLAYDARGHGRSGGRAMEFGWGGEADVVAAVDELVERGVGVGRIAVYGSSLGGEVALAAAAREERISAVVAEGATGRSAEDHRWLVDAYGWRGSVQMWVDGVTYGFVDALVSEDPPRPLRDQVARASVPVLLVTAGAEPDEALAARWIRDGSRAVEIATVEGDHTRGLETAPDEWTERVVGFVDAALAP